MQVLLPGCVQDLRIARSSDKYAAPLRIKVSETAGDDDHEKRQ